MCVCLLHSCAQTYSLRGLVFIPTCVCSLPVSDAQKKLGDPRIAEVLLSNPQEVHIGAHTRVWETEMLSLTALHWQAALLIESSHKMCALTFIYENTRSQL